MKHKNDREVLLQLQKFFLYVRVVDHHIVNFVWDSFTSSDRKEFSVIWKINEFCSNHIYYLFWNFLSCTELFRIPCQQNIFYTLSDVFFLQRIKWDIGCYQVFRYYGTVVESTYFETSTKLICLRV